MQAWSATENACLLCFIAQERATNQVLTLKHDLLVDVCKHPIFSERQRTPAAVRKHFELLPSTAQQHPEIVSHVTATASHLTSLVASWISQHVCESSCNTVVQTQDTHDTTSDTITAECVEEWKGLIGMQHYDESFRGRSENGSWGIQEHASAGLQFRQHMIQNTPNQVCACCARYLPNKSVSRHDIDQVPNIQLLRCDGAKTAETPRHSHTKISHAGVEYCLTSDGVFVTDKRIKAQVRSCWV